MTEAVKDTITWEMIEKAADKLCDNEGSYWTANRWQKNGYDRVYINICKKNHRYSKKGGYWDMTSEKYIAPAKGINLAELV